MRNRFSLRVTHREFRALAYIPRNSDLAFVSSVNVMSYSTDRSLECLCNRCHILRPNPACWKKGCSQPPGGGAQGCLHHRPLTIWKCERGYRAHNEDCIAIEVPTNTYLSCVEYGLDWKSERGFLAVGSACVELQVPDSAHLNYSGNSRDCNRPYRKHLDRCVLRRKVERVLRSQAQSASTQPVPVTAMTMDGSSTAAMICRTID